MEKLSDQDKFELLNKYLVNAIEQYSLNEVKLFVDLGAPLEVVTRLRIDDSKYIKAAPLNFAVRLNSHRSIVEYLIQNGAKIDAVDDKGNNALVNAVQYCHLDTIRLLINKGADVNFQNGEGVSALHLAAAGDKMDRVALLIESGADIHIKTKTNDTVLHYAARPGCGSSDVVKHFINLGVDINAQNKSGRTILMDFLKYKNLSIANHVISKSKDFNLQDASGMTALHEAVDHLLDVQVGKLLKLKANPNLRNSKNETPIFLAMYNFDYSKEKVKNRVIIDQLLLNGADVNIQNISGETPLMRAIKEKLPLAVIEKIAEKTTTFSLKNNESKTALDFAIDRGDQKLIAFIESKTLSQTINQNDVVEQGMNF